MTVYQMQVKQDFKAFRFPHWVGMILLLASYTVLGVFGMRSDLIAAGFGYQGLFGLFGSDGLSLKMSGAIYLLSGLWDWIVFELLAWVFATMVRMRFPHFNSGNLRHILRIFFVARNLILAPIYTVLFLYPLSIVWVTTVVNFVVTTLCVVGFFFYYADRNLPVFLYGPAMQIMGQYYLLFHILIGGMLFMGMAL